MVRTVSGISPASRPLAGKIASAWLRAVPLTLVSGIVALAPSPSAHAAAVQVPGLANGAGNIQCQDTVRTHVRNVLSGSLARIESSAEASDAAAERAVAQLESVVARATSLANSRKYSGKAQAQCVLAFLAESCNLSRDRIAGGDVLSEAVGGELSDESSGTSGTSGAGTSGTSAGGNQTGGASSAGTSGTSAGGNQTGGASSAGTSGTSAGGNQTGGASSAGTSGTSAGGNQTGGASSAGTSGTSAGNASAGANPNTANTGNASTPSFITSFELSKTSAAIGETVPFTYSVSTDRTCDIYVVSSQRKLLANLPAGISGNSSYKTIASEASNGIIALEMACTNGSRKTRSITVRGGSTTSTAPATETATTTTAATTATTRAIEWPDQWICTGDGANQMFCSINRQTACPSSPPYTPRSGRSYRAQTPQCSTGIGEGCMCIYNISTGIWTASTTINQALLTSETAPMVHLDPVGNGSVVKVIEYTVPAGSNSATVQEYQNRYKTEMETYVQSNGIRVTGQVSPFSKYVACTPGSRETHYNVWSQYDVSWHRGKVYLYKHDFLCVGANYLVRWLNEIDVNVAARTVTATKGKMYFQNTSLLDPDGANAPQIQLTGNTYKTIHLTGKQCTLSFTDGTASEAAVNNGTIPQKFLTGIDGGKVVQLLCSTTGTEKMAYMSKYNNKYHFVNIIHFQ